MNLIASFSRSSLLRLCLVNVFFGAIVMAAAYFGSRALFSPQGFSDLMDLARQHPEMQAWARENGQVFLEIQTFFYPGFAGLMLILTLVQWGVIRAGFKRVARKAGIPDAPVKGGKKTLQKDKKQEAQKSTPEISEQARKEQYERYYLHLVSILQRHGRLVDFFHEDLTAYADAQIGAAVRSIHENCASTMKKAVAPKSVIDRPEGQEITVPAGFDPAAIKLTGNVTGEPPFTGVLRHRGWRADKLELPMLSASGDSRIIAPAEVEIQ